MIFSVQEIIAEITKNYIKVITIYPAKRKRYEYKI